MPLRRRQFGAQGSHSFKKIKILSRLSTIALIGALVLVLAVVIGIVVLATQIPPPDQLENRAVASSTKIYDRNGELLYNIFQNENRTPVKLTEIPDYVKQATISIEDKNFYHEQGFSITGIGRSVIALIAHRQIEGGGSTLTQQLVKNALLGDEQSFTRKLKELVLAIQVERVYTKDQILEMYLNEIPYGGTAYGIEAAANLYFGMHAKDLDLAESSLLAGLPQLPSVYSPYGTHPELAKVRQKQVLDRMRDDKDITQQQDTAAYNEQLTYRTSQNQAGFEAPHFVLYVKQKLIDQFGEKEVETGGLKVTTSLDNKLEVQAQQIVHDEVAKLTSYKVGNGAAVVMDPRNGQILAMVGSKDYFATDYDGNFNVALANRQPGSSTKPITYSAGLQKGYTAATMLMDVKTNFPGGDKSDYVPVNYDGRFRGPIQVRYALGNSINIPAVKMLAMVGVKNVMDLGYRMGLSNWEPTDENVNNAGLSLTLGGREVSLLDLTSAYAVFADLGNKQDPVSILKVSDQNGKTLYETHDSDGVKILDPGIAFIISNILADNGARTEAFGSNSVLNIPGKTVSVKTGTTDEKKDNWAIGYTPSVVVGVWVGNNDDTAMNPAIASGITGASPIWQKIMIAAIKDKPNETFKQPDDVSYVDVDGLMGGQPHDGSPTRKEYFIKGSEPTAPSSAYQNLKVCNSNPHRLANDNEDGSNKDVVVLKEDDPTGANKWQDGIDQWVLTAGDARLVGVTKGCSGVPGFAGGGSSGSIISIANIPNGANVPRVFDVLAQTNSPAGIKNVTWSIDGATKNVETASPFAQHVEFPDGDKGSHTISVTLIDNNGVSSTASIGVTVSL